MKSKETIHIEIEKTFNAIENIERVEVNHFFKHKVLQRIAKEQEEKQLLFSWLTPQFQLATLSVILLLNVGAIFYAFSNTNNTVTTDLDTFAQEYSLQSSSSSILN
jgi:hypothetical protein